MKDNYTTQSSNNVVLHCTACNSVFERRNPTRRTYLEINDLLSRGKQSQDNRIAPEFPRGWAKCPTCDEAKVEVFKSITTKIKEVKAERTNSVAKPAPVPASTSKLFDKVRDDGKNSGTRI